MSFMLVNGFWAVSWGLRNYEDFLNTFDFLFWHFKIKIGRIIDKENTIILSFLPIDTPKSFTLDLHYKNISIALSILLCCLVSPSSSAMVYWHLTGKLAPPAVFFLNETTPNIHTMVMDGWMVHPLFFLGQFAWN